MDDWQDRDLDDLIGNDPKARERIRKADEAKAKETAGKTNGQGKGKPEKPQPSPDTDTWRSRLKPCSAADVEGKPIKERKFFWSEWIPDGHLSGLFGRGGGGKTTLGMQLGAEGSVGGNVLGVSVRKCKPLAVLCEDDEGEIERRIRSIAHGYNRKLSDYRDFHYLPRLGDDNLLVARTRAGLQTTPFYEDLSQMVADEHHNMLIIDGIVEVFGGSINDPTETSFFMNRLLAMVRPVRSTILLLGHPNKAGTSEFSGCATWENKPRARLYLGPPKQDDEGEPDLNDPRRLLSKSKANLSVRDQIEIVWRDGMFRAADPKFMTMDEKCERSAQEAKAREAFLAGIDRLNAAGATTSLSKNAGNFAPKRIVEMHMDGGFTAKQLADAMTQLLADGLIRFGEAGYSKNRNKQNTVFKVGA
jgi:RecA-family ATPase